MGPMKFTVDKYREKLTESSSTTVTSLKFSPDGDWLASSYEDGLIKIWGVRREEKSMKQFKCQGHEAGINDIAWSTKKDNDANNLFSYRLRLISASNDTTLRVWIVLFDCGNVVTEKEQELKGHTKAVYSCNFNPESTLIVSGSVDETARIWSYPSGDCLQEIIAHPYPVSSVQFSPDGSKILSCSYDGLCRVWEKRLDQWRSTKTLLDDENPPLSTALFSLDSQFILAAAMNGSLKLWDYSKGRCVRTFRGHKNEKHCILAHFLPAKERMWIVSGSEDGFVYIWNMQTGGVHQKLSGHSGVVLCTAVHPSGSAIASAAMGNNDEIKLWWRSS